MSSSEERLMRPGDADPTLMQKLSAENGGVNPKDLVGITKPRLSLVPPASILYTAMGLQDGAKKYGPYNWREKPVKLSIYIEAKLRHLLGFWDGEDDAHDSRWPHLAHDSACSAIIIDAKHIPGCLVDDRPKAGGAGMLIEKMTRFMAAKAAGEDVYFSSYPDYPES
jgi:hypothetical protein